MVRTRRQQEFVESKCDRCGRTTSFGGRDGEGLYVLEHDMPHGMADQGAFCLDCIARYDVENWLAWFRQHRPSVLNEEVR